MQHSNALEAVDEIERSFWSYGLWTSDATSRLPLIEKSANHARLHLSTSTNSIPGSVLGSEVGDLVSNCMRLKHQDQQLVRPSISLERQTVTRERFHVGVTLTHPTCSLYHCYTTVFTSRLVPKLVDHA